MRQVQFWLHFITDNDFPFVTDIESVIAILKGIYKPHWKRDE